MRSVFIRYIPSVQSSKSLVFRGGLARTFGSLAGFMVVTFLCVGLYILEEAFANPLQAGAAAVITAAFIITLAAMLLFFLLQPGKRIRMANPDRFTDSATPGVKPIAKPVAGGRPPRSTTQQLVVSAPLR